MEKVRNLIVHSLFWYKHSRAVNEGGRLKPRKRKWFFTKHAVKPQSYETARITVYIRKYLGLSVSLNCKLETESRRLEGDT